MTEDLKRIKKLYGEKMMRLCRELFPTILEEPGALVKTLTEAFEPNRSLYEDITTRGNKEDFQEFIIGLYEEKIDSGEIETTKKGVKELLSEAGYNFYECKTEEDIQSFRPYYKSGEEICTFWTHRLADCYVFFAVKKNVKKIRRENFPHPERQDEYGTSVISIQFARNKNNTLSIKNRYNHTVRNPDATFSNNLENIIPGLTAAFAREYNFNKNCSSKYELYNYVQDAEGKYYRYNYEIDNVYYCAGNVVIENFEAKRYEKEKFVLMDYFLLDLVNKKIMINPKSKSVVDDSFLEDLKDIEKIEIKNQPDGTKKIHIMTSTKHEIIIGINNLNQIVSYHNPRLVKAGNKFLHKNKTLKHLSLPNLEETGSYFLYHNEELEEINLPKLKKAGAEFMIFNEKVNSVSMPNLEETVSGFLCRSKLTEVNFPKLRIAGDNFINLTHTIKKINIPNLEETKGDFINRTLEIQEINFPKLKIAGSNFLSDLEKVEKVYFPLLEEVGDYFLRDCESIEEINQPLLKKVGDAFLYRNNKIKHLSLPSLEEAGDFLLYRNTIIDKVDLPKLKAVGYGFLECNKALTSISLQSIETAGDRFLEHNEIINNVDLPMLKKVGERFLGHSQNLTSLSLPLLQKAGAKFLEHNQTINSVDLPMLKEVGDNFLERNQNITTLSLPLLQKTGTNFLGFNQILYKFNLPNLKEVGDGFLRNNQRLLIASLPSLKKASKYFIAQNKTLKVLIAPNLQAIREGFLENNEELSFLDISSAKTIVKAFLLKNKQNIQIFAHKLAKNKREELKTRFEVISRLDKSNDNSNQIDEEELYGIRIKEVLNSDSNIISIVNEQIRNGINIAIQQSSKPQLKGVAA